MLHELILNNNSFLTQQSNWQELWRRNSPGVAVNDGQKEGNHRKGMIQRFALQPLRASQCKGEISLFICFLLKYFSTSTRRFE